MPRKELITAAAEPTREDSAIQVETTLPLRPRRHECRKDGQPNAASAESRSRIPRVTRLMALAIRFQGMIDCGEVRDYADLAQLGYVTRARMTQIMNLLLLAPEIQEGILDDLSTSALQERQLRQVVTKADWTEQRAILRTISGSAGFTRAQTGR